jgi:transposase-like protein
MSRALGVSPSTLRRWRQLDAVPKPAPGRQGPPLTPLPPLTERARAASAAIAVGLTDSAFLSASSASASSASTSASAQSVPSSGRESAAASISAWVREAPSASSSSRADGSAPGLASRQAVLVLTGDPRRGGNVFDLEVAAIRRQLFSGLVTSRHLVMIELGEIAAAIDRERPVVLHVSAHNGCGGVVLSSHGREHIVDPVEVADAIDRADHRPTCVLLEFCGSDLVARQVARTTPAVISWPGEVSDEQGTYFAEEFYRHLAMRGTLGRAFREGCASVNSRCAGIAAPVLRSRWQGPLL